MATVSTGHTFFQDQSPPDDLEEAQKKVKHFAETHVPSGRPVVLITVSSRDDQSLPRVPSPLRAGYGRSTGSPRPRRTIVMLEGTVFASRVGSVEPQPPSLPDPVHVGIAAAA